MKVSELIEHLKQFDPDLPVYRITPEDPKYHMPLEADDVCVDKLNKGWFGDDIDAFHEAVII